MGDIEAKTKKKKMVAVNVISATVNTVLVEFTADGLLMREYIPTVEVIDGKAPEDVLMAGIPYGVDWEDIKLKASAIELANALRMNGIWTCEDAMKNPNKIISALQAVYGVDLAALLKHARENK